MSLFTADARHPRSGLRNSPMSRPNLDRRIAAVRHFNRFYTQRIGLLQAAWLNSPFSLTEARVLYELAHREQPTASALAKDLGLDAGYLSRILRAFGKRGLVSKQASSADGRQSLLSITERGRKTFAPLESAQPGRDLRCVEPARRPRAGTHGRSDADDRATARRAGRAKGALHLAAARAGRHGLGRQPSRCALRPRIRLERSRSKR